MDETNESGRENMVEMPGTLDIVKINGRWAQTVSSSTVGELTVKFLDAGGLETINLQDYHLEQLYKQDLGLLADLGRVILTPAE